MKEEKAKRKIARNQDERRKKGRELYTFKMKRKKREKYIDRKKIK